MAGASKANTILIASGADNSANEGVAWVVQSASLSQMMRQLYELLWSVSRKMETA